MFMFQYVLSYCALCFFLLVLIFCSLSLLYNRRFNLPVVLPGLKDLPHKKRNTVKSQSNDIKEFSLKSPVHRIWLISQLWIRAGLAQYTQSINNACTYLYIMKHRKEHRVYLAKNKYCISLISENPQRQNESRGFVTW